jgi:hypothetical protein
MSVMHAHANLQHLDMSVPKVARKTPTRQGASHKPISKGQIHRNKIHAQVLVVHRVCPYSVMSYPRNIKDFTSIWKPQFELFHCVAPSKP